MRLRHLHPCFTAENLRNKRAAKIIAITAILIHVGMRIVLVLTYVNDSVNESPLEYVPPKEAVSSMQAVESAPNAL